MPALDCPDVPFCLPGAGTDCTGLDCLVGKDAAEILTAGAKANAGPGPVNRCCLLLYIHAGA